MVTPPTCHQGNPIILLLLNLNPLTCSYHRSGLCRYVNYRTINMSLATETTLTETELLYEKRLSECFSCVALKHLFR